MKRSQVKEIIEKVLSDVSDDPADEILNALLKAGMLPPRRDYIEHFGWKSDNTWDKE
jgi:hypothetical protein